MYIIRTMDRITSLVVCIVSRDQGESELADLDSWSEVVDKKSSNDSPSAFPEENVCGDYLL